MPEQIAYADFERVDIRVGTVIEASPFPEAEAGDNIVAPISVAIGVKILGVHHGADHTPEKRIGRQVLVGCPVPQIGPFRSEVLTLGFEDAAGAIVLAQPGLAVPDGKKLL